MPQVFGVDEIGLISHASLWTEAASESDVEKATNPDVAAEARSRGLVPLRMGLDPIWHHPETGRSFSLAPAHSGERSGYRRIKNDIADLRRNLPTAEETARATRTPEEVEAEQVDSANATRTKKQQAIDAAKRARDREQAASNRNRAETEQILFQKEHGPFRNMNEVQKAFDARSPKARIARPEDNIDDFAARLRGLAPENRQQIHKIVFPEKYK